ncbi:hypothetical protein HHX47_DHR5000458, partial [Lentinula edodes]
DLHLPRARGFYVEGLQTQEQDQRLVGLFAASSRWRGVAPSGHTTSFRNQDLSGYLGLIVSRGPPRLSYLYRDGNVNVPSNFSLPHHSRIFSNTTLDDNKFKIKQSSVATEVPDTLYRTSLSAMHPAIM